MSLDCFWNDKKGVHIIDKENITGEKNRKLIGYCGVIEEGWCYLKTPQSIELGTMKYVETHNLEFCQRCSIKYDELASLESVCK